MRMLMAAAVAVLLAAQNQVKEVQVAPAAATVAVGQATRLHAMAYDQAGNVIASGVRYTWSSNNVNIARVDSLGNVTAVAVGTTLIRAEAVGSGNPLKAAAATVTVRQ